MYKYFLLFSILAYVGCKPCKDPAPFSDSRISNHYCNVPSAINYNWNFPGIEDNTTCVYPAQIYKGNYFYRDSIFNAEGHMVGTDSFMLSFTQIDSTHLTITGFCGTTVFTAKANRFYKFTLDSLQGNGQYLCSTADTIAGSGSKTGLDDSTTMKLNYQVSKAIGGVFTHYGIATKQ